jgi:hypothetical protein
MKIYLIKLVLDKVSSMDSTLNREYVLSMTLNFYILMPGIEQMAMNHL